MEMEERWMEAAEARDAERRTRELDALRSADTSSLPCCSPSSADEPSPTRRTEVRPPFFDSERCELQIDGGVGQLN